VGDVGGCPEIAGMRLGRTGASYGSSSNLPNNAEHSSSIARLYLKRTGSDSNDIGKEKLSGL